jgi:hypothetical protein
VEQENSTDSLPDTHTRTPKRGVQIGQLISDINYFVSLQQTHKSRQYELNDGAKDDNPPTDTANRYPFHDIPEAGLIHDQERRNYDEDNAVQNVDERS